MVKNCLSCPSTDFCPSWNLGELVKYFSFLSFQETQFIHILEWPSFLKSWVFSRLIFFLNLHGSIWRPSSGLYKTHRCYFWLMNSVTFESQESYSSHSEISWCCGKLTLHFLSFSFLFCVYFLSFQDTWVLILPAQCPLKPLQEKVWGCITYCVYGPCS